VFHGKDCTLKLKGPNPYWEENSKKPQCRCPGTKGHHPMCNYRGPKQQGTIPGQRK
jgi:hypothetical protein